MTARLLLYLALAGILVACGSTPPTVNQPSTASTVPGGAKGGGYYLDDGPGENPPADLAGVADAVPRLEPLHRFANRQYVVLGQSYVPDTALKPYRAEGRASWYGRRFHGKRTASGELYDMYAMTAAHRTLPIPSYARVTSLETGKSVIVRVNDRGPFHRDRLVDLSYTAASKLGFVGKGSARVRVESIDPSGFDARRGSLRPGHYVQMGAFGRLANAETLQLRAQQALGLSADMMQVALRDNLHRLNVGPFVDAMEASRWADIIRATLDIETLTLVR